MIKTNDLRIGNLINDKNGFLLKVVAVFKEEVFLDFKGNKGYFFEEDFKKIQPYPITEKLLLKLSAVKLTSKKEPSYVLSGLEISFINDVWIENVNQVKLNGLHELQNLFYVIKAKELDTSKIE